MDVQSQIEELKCLVAKLKKNDECVPREDLETKYKKPYQKLKEDIGTLATKVADEIINENLRFIDNEEGRLYFQKIQDLVKSITPEESKKLGRCLGKEYDVDRFLARMYAIKGKVIEAYVPYGEKYRTFGENTERLGENMGRLSENTER